MQVSYIRFEDRHQLLTDFLLDLGVVDQQVRHQRHSVARRLVTESKVR